MSVGLVSVVPLESRALACPKGIFVCSNPMKNLKLPSQEYLLSLLRYDPETGYLHWLPQPGRRCNSVRKRAGCFSSKDYRVIRIDGKLYKEHRIIWVMCKGSIEDKFDVDHIDHNKSNNRIENLQCISRQANLARRPCGPGRSR